MAQENNAIRWHRGFRGGMRLLYWEYRDALEFLEEIPLNNDSLFADLVLAKKDETLMLLDDMGRLFRRYNVFEYKSYADALNIIIFHQAVLYAFLLIYENKFPDLNPARDITVFVVRHSYPRELFRSLQELGAVYQQVSRGIYRVDHFVYFPVYVVVSRELDPESYATLRVLVPNAQESDVRQFMHQTAVKQHEMGYKQNVDAVLQVSAAANQELFKQLRREQDMFEYFHDMMKDEFDRAKREGELHKAESIARKLILWNVTPEAIMAITDLPYSKLQEIASDLQMPLPAPGNS